MFILNSSLFDCGINFPWFRDLVNLICAHLDLFRAAITKIEKQHTDSLTIESRDTEIKIVLAAEDKLHPALFSSEAEHKVVSRSCSACIHGVLGNFVYSHGVKLLFLIFLILGYNDVRIFIFQVLQHLMNGLISVTFKSEDLQCSFFRYTVRELLACCVMRPVLNLANPR